MPLDLLPACVFTGPALPEPFVRLELEQALTKAGLLARGSGTEGKALHESWERYERKLRELVVRGGSERVFNHVLLPLVERLGYAQVVDGGKVRTSLEDEDGGRLFVAADGSRLRVWASELEADLDAPGRRGAAARYSLLRVAQRVLLAERERMGLLTNGVELRLVISDPARTDSQVIMPIATLWGRRRAVPDSYRLLLALAAPAGLRQLPTLIEQARQQQTRVTNDLRRQAREAIEGFIQAILDHPENRGQGAENREQGTENREQGAELIPDPRPLTPETLWREGLVVVYRLLVILKLAASDDPARRFSFADSAIWRGTYAPGTALAPIVRAVLDEGAETGQLLEEGLRQLFRLFAEGVESQELTVKPLAGGLFDPAATPTLAGLRWGERAVALLLDRLLWTPRGKGSSARERVSYAALDVEDLGRVYEALLELEPGIAAEPMCRLRRQKLEVVVPIAQGEKYRQGNGGGAVGAEHAPPSPPTDGSDETNDAEPEDDDEIPARGKKTKVEWIEAIPPGRFYLRVGLGRKSSGSYYTPRSFVRFLVQETVGPQCDERSPDADPQPARILALRVLDPAMGSGHFLVEACRFLGDRLYEACRRCDELASAAEAQAAKLKERDPAEVARLAVRAEELRQRVEALPDPDNALVAYLPSRAREGDQPGLSERKARALCRRLAAVHCLYGVDKNPLAVALARVAIWIESHAEGLPLTFLDHRLVLGDSLTGPFAEHLARYPGSQQPLDDIFNQGLQARLQQSLAAALSHVAALEESVGIDVADIERKRAAKTRLDAALAPFRLLAAAWAGGVMLGKGGGCDDDSYATLAHAVAASTDLALPAALRRMLARGLGLRELPEGIASLAAVLKLLAPDSALSPQPSALVPALPYDLAFPEVFYPAGKLGERQGFDVVVGNPPWDTVRPLAKEFYASLDLGILEAPTKREREETEKRLSENFEVNKLFREYVEDFSEQERIHFVLYLHQRVIVEGRLSAGDPDLAKLFAERITVVCVKGNGRIGFVMPGAFHAASGTVGVRRLYLNNTNLLYLLSFNNANSLFEVETKVKFDIVVSSNTGRPTSRVKCRFRMTRESDIADRENLMDLELKEIRAIGGVFENFIELDSSMSLDIVRSQKSCISFAQWSEEVGLRFRNEIHPTSDSKKMTPARTVIGKLDSRDSEVLNELIKKGYLVVGGEDSIHLYNDHWTEPPRYIVHVNELKARTDWLSQTRHYRLFYRRIANIVDLRSMKAGIVPPGWISSSPFASSFVEAKPLHFLLNFLSLLNSFMFDYYLRLRLTATLSSFLVNSVPVPAVLASERFLAHSALRLTCNHAGYEALWREQVGEAWREERAPFDWPVLKDDDARWAVRAAIDAVVAEAYGLSREQYAHVLSTFSHKSYPKAPERCLAAFDELKTLGLEAFTKQHDPYWDIPLNENLPEPVIELPLPEGSGVRGQGSGVQGGRRGRKASVEEPAPLYAEPQLALDLGEESPPAQQIIDFAAAAERVSPRPMRKAAEGRQGYRADEAERYERVKALLAERASLSSGEVQGALKVDAATARALLRRLVDEGLARVEGEKRGTRYIARSGSNE